MKVLDIILPSISKPFILLYQKIIAQNYQLSLYSYCEEQTSDATFAVKGGAHQKLALVSLQILDILAYTLFISYLPAILCSTWTCALCKTFTILIIFFNSRLTYPRAFLSAHIKLFLACYISSVPTRSK